VQVQVKKRVRDLFIRQLLIDQKGEKPGSLFLPLDSVIKVTSRRLLWCFPGLM
jgi:hypothetical protein